LGGKLEGAPYLQHFQVSALELPKDGSEHDSRFCFLSCFKPTSSLSVPTPYILLLYIQLPIDNPKELAVSRRRIFYLQQWGELECLDVSAAQWLSKDLRNQVELEVQE